MSSPNANADESKSQGDAPASIETREAEKKRHKKRKQRRNRLLKRQGYQKQYDFPPVIQPSNRLQAEAMTAYNAAQDNISDLESVSSPSESGSYPEDFGYGGGLHGRSLDPNMEMNSNEEDDVDELKDAVTEAKEKNEDPDEYRQPQRLRKWDEGKPKGRREEQQKQQTERRKPKKWNEA